LKPLRCLSGFGSELRSCGAISVLLYAVHPSAASVANQESRPCDPHAQGEGVLCDRVIMRVLDCRVLGNPQSRERIALVAGRAGLVNGQGWQW